MMSNKIKSKKVFVGVSIVSKQSYGSFVFKYLR